MTTPTQGRDEALERLYALVANEEDARACKDISEDACREVPGNFFLMLASLVLTKAGDRSGFSSGAGSCLSAPMPGGATKPSGQVLSVVSAPWSARAMAFRQSLTRFW